MLKRVRGGEGVNVPNQMIRDWEQLINIAVKNTSVTQVNEPQSRTQRTAGRRVRLRSDRRRRRHWHADTRSNSFKSTWSSTLPRFFSLSVSLFCFSPLATLKASWRTMWNLIGWCTIGSRQGGMAKCPGPSLATRLADKGRTWGTGPSLFAQRMVQSPSGPCKENAGIFILLFFFFNLGPLSLIW